ncbi:uncharacterized protein LOC125663021 [Ostrea edulis]|uniref:uncharacterized protein LOC125663021 n=1 Tax=Ostrea edulis TaxID=37623 RepID=UPI0024AEF500|nr:uncharacterized protein LOC125663021 [Ostrea edulis]
MAESGQEGELQMSATSPVNLVMAAVPQSVELSSMGLQNSQEAMNLPAPTPYINNIGMHVVQAIRQKIIEGRYIDLVSLLPPKAGGGGRERERERERERKLVMNNLGEIVTRDSTPKRIESIEKWTDVMLNFAAIYLKEHPAKNIDLLKYIQTVRMGAGRGYKWWYEYDIQYRLRKVNDPGSSWGEVDSELWLMYMTPSSVETHTLSLKQAPAAAGKCYDFNFQGSCSKFPCFYDHMCLRCNGQHAMMHCPGVYQP